MRRALPVAMLSALLAVTPAALAQRGGTVGHAGGGFHGGYSGFHGGFSGYSGFRGGYSAPRSFGQFVGSAPRVFSGVPRYGMTTGRLPAYRSTYPAYRTPYRSGAGADRRGGNRRGHDRDRYRRSYGGYAYPYVYANSWQLLPWDLNADVDDEAVSASQQPGEAQTEPEAEPEPAVPESSYREDYVPAPAAAQAPIAPEPQLTLIFKDGHTQQIRNYALTQDALIDLDQANSGRVARIPLASLDVPATEKAAQQAGLDFTPPSL